MDFDPRYNNYNGYNNMNQGANMNVPPELQNQYNYNMYNPWSQRQNQRNRLNMMERQNQQFANNLAYYNNQGMNDMNNVPMNNGDNNISINLKGRPVSNFEEANAYIISLDGSTFYFPNLNKGEIYTKQIGLDGNAILNVYKLVPQQPQNAQQNYSQQDYSNVGSEPLQKPSESPVNNNIGVDKVIPVDNSKEVELLNQKVKNLELYVNKLEREINNYVQSNASDNANAWGQSTRKSNDESNVSNNELTKSYADNAIDVWQQSEDATSYERNAR